MTGRYFPPTVDVHRGDPGWDDSWITELDAADQTEENDR